MIAQLDGSYVLTRPGRAATRLVSYALFEGRPLTTRGRWINPLVFANLALAKRLPQLRKVKKPVFIVGAGRSGTTILGSALSMHRGVGFLNEPKALWHAIIPTEDVVGNYTKRQARYRLNAQDASEDVIRSAHRIYGAYLTTTWTHRVVDKYPELIFRIPFVQAIFPDARFIMVVRNGWETCASIARWSEKYGTTVEGERHDWWGNDRRKWKLLQKEIITNDPIYHDLCEIVYSLERGLDMAAVEWIVTMQEGLRYVESDPSRILTVRYEELTERPREILSRICEFTELGDDQAFLDYAERVFRPPISHGKFEMNPVLLELFMKTMKNLGY